MDKYPTFYQVLNTLDVDCTIYVSVNRGPWKSLDKIRKEHSIKEYVQLQVDLIDIGNTCLIINCRKDS